MKIQSIESFTKGSLSIVRVRTDEGAEGYGQIAPFNANISAMVLHQQVAGCLDISQCDVPDVILFGRGSEGR